MSDKLAKATSVKVNRNSLILINGPSHDDESADPRKDGDTSTSSADHQNMANLGLSPAKRKDDSRKSFVLTSANARHSMRIPLFLLSQDQNITLDSSPKNENSICSISNNNSNNAATGADPATSPSRTRMSIMSVDALQATQDATSPMAETVRPSIRVYRKASIALQRMPAIERESLSPLGTSTAQSPNGPRDSMNSSLSNRYSRMSAYQKKNSFPSRDISAHRQEQASLFISALQTIEQSKEKDFSTPSSVTESSTIPLPPPQPHLLQDVQTNIDYSELFPENIGQVRGTFIFRMEGLAPILLEEGLFGKFCVADAYIILYSTIKENTFLDNSSTQNSQLDHQVYTWIGSDAETDKRFCCAMYAVALRNLIHSDSRIKRQVQSDECEEFKELFRDVFELLDSSFATETGLSGVQHRRYPVKLYRIDQKSPVAVFLVFFSKLWWI